MIMPSISVQVIYTYTCVMDLPLLCQCCASPFFSRKQKKPFLSVAFHVPEIPRVNTGYFTYLSKSAISNIIVCLLTFPFIYDFPFLVLELSNSLVCVCQSLFFFWFFQCLINIIYIQAECSNRAI